MGSQRGRSPLQNKIGLLFLAFCCLLADWLKLLPRCRADLFGSEGPQFLSEPSRINYFTNVQGLLLHCTARGSPSPRLSWINQKTGQPVESIPGVRELYSNGTMQFPPFAVAYYRPDIHDQVYVCLAENSVGKLRSRDVHVRAVINQQFDVRVESAYTSEGNDALLTCVIPDPVKDFVSVTSWVKDSTLNIFPPHSGGGSRYFMAPSGELLIESVSRNDSSSSFRCRTVNRLTDETQLSESSAGLQLKGGKSVNTAPRIVSRVPRVRLKEGDVGVIFCLSEGHPPPAQTWHKVQIDGGLEPLRSSERVRIRQSAVIMETVIAQDSGSYVCVANNTSGSDRYTVQVEVSKSLEVQIVPNVLTVDIGKSAEMTCWTNRAFDVVTFSSTSSSTKMSSNTPASPSSTVSVLWRKDGVEIRPTLRTSFSPAGEKLRIASVQREDKGMYQCFIKSDSDMAQAAAELRLGDSHPQLIYRFIEQTLRPGGAVSIKCSATGNPPPHITWLLDGFPLPHSDRLLIGQYVTMNGDVVSHVNITATRVEDGGEFQCMAANKLGTTVHSARLNVYGAPFVRTMPSTVTAVAGKAFHIKCPVAGYPISGITWEKDDLPLPSNIRQSVSPNGTLTIKDVDRNVDSGWYTCTASNKQGNSNRRGVHINVVVPPKLAPFSFPVSPLEGERILAMCGVSDGDSPVRLQWLKDSVPIHSTANSSDVSTHQMSDFGVLALQIPHVSWNDTGNYSCVAQNAAGHASLTLSLVVHVPPRIAPYTFPSPVLENSRVQVVCSVEQGDVEETNLTVSWLKDDELLHPGGGGGGRLISLSLSTNAKVMQVDAYSAILIIERVDSERDSGNYTCQISNSVEEVHKTNELVVRVPPKWVNEPRDSEVTEGKSLTIPCGARGFPSPKISWKKAMSIRAENFRDIPISSSQPGHPYHNSPAVVDPASYLNGTLFIPVVRKSHHGFYLCEASNGIGSGLSKVIRLSVNVPIRIKEPPQNVSASVGADAVLRCEISGDPPLLNVGWRKGLDEIKSDGSDSSRYRVWFRNTTGHGSVSGERGSLEKNATTTALMELKVINVGRHDSGRYLCHAGNHHGESQADIWLYVQEPPDVPRNLHVIGKGSRFVRLGWTLTQSSNSHLTQFLVQYQTVGGSRKSHQLSVSGSTFSETIRDLHPATAYTFTVIAENQVGQSGPSETFEVKTDGEAPDGKVRTVQLIAVSSSDVQVSWENPEKDTWHGQLLGYYVGYRKLREGEQYQFSTLERKEQALQEFLVSGLTPFTSYEIIVQPYNGIGAGPMSDAITVTTLEDVPVSFPEGTKCSALTSDSLQMTWSPLTGEGARGIITGYRVTLELLASDSPSTFLEETEDFPVSRTTGTTSVIFNSLAKYTNYSVQVEGFTAVGSGPPSRPVYCSTDEDVPSSPTAVKAVITSPTTITLSWLPPAEPNGQLTRYTLYVSLLPNISSGKREGRVSTDVQKKVVPPTTHKFQFEGLRPNEKYEFRVSASTKVGEGPFVAVEQTPRNSAVPSIVSFGREWRVIWKTDVHLDCETVGNSSIQWTKFSRLVRPSERMAVSRDGSLFIREVKREDSGNYTCSINTSDRNGGDGIVHKLIVQVPPMAPLMTVAGTSFTMLNLQWKLSDSGGAPIKGFVLHVKASEEWVEKRLSRRLSAYELQGLECGTYYQMYLTAYNRAGMGRASELVNVSTLGSAPTLKLLSPEFMVQSNASVTRVLLKDAWSGNGCQISMFRVFYKGADRSHWQVVDGGEVAGDSHSVDLLGLKSSSQYQLRVVALNSAGTQQVELTINTPELAKQSSSNAGTTPSADVRNQLAATPFYLDVKLMGPTILSLIVLVVVGFSACFYYKRKVSVNGPSDENMGAGTPTSSLYFKQDPHQQLFHHAHLQHHHPTQIRGGPPPSQMYMTVKKATPLKGVDMAEVGSCPKYADEVYSYATFEVNEPPQRDSRACNNLSMASRRPSMNQHFHPHDHPSDGDDSDEHDSYESESEYEDEPIPPSHQQHQPHSHKSRLISNLAGSPAGLPGTAQKFQDYDSHTRCGNRYEFVLPSHPRAGTLTRDGNGAHANKNTSRHPSAGRCEEARKYGDGDNPGKDDEMIHGRITSGPYAFNDSYPTAVIQDKRGSSRKKSGRRKFHVSNLEAYVVSEEINPGQCPLDPPEGFMDTLNHKAGVVDKVGGGEGGLKGLGKQHGGKTGASGKRGNEYAIAV